MIWHCAAHPAKLLSFFDIFFFSAIFESVFYSLPNDVSIYFRERRRERDGNINVREKRNID